MPLAMAGGALVLAACSTPLAVLHELEDAVSRAEWQGAPMHQAWTYPPGAQLLLMRRHGRVAEQRIALANPTALPGDNFIFMRSVPGRSAGTIRLEQVIGQSGGLPGPFADDDIAVMRTTEDAAGALSWAEWTSGAGTTCVLAFRQLTVQTRVLPSDTSAINLMMRNCVRGTAQDALESVDGDLVALPASVRLSHGAGQPPLSSLAAPGQ